MTVNFLYKGQQAGGVLIKRKAQISMTATVVLVMIVVVVAGMLGIGVHISRENTRLGDEERKLGAEEVKLAAAEARVWQIDDRARVVLAEVRSVVKMSETMLRMTPGTEVELVGWSWGNDKGTLEAESAYPEILEEYAGQLRSVYPQSAVGNVVWGVGGKWQMSVNLEGGKK